MNMWCTTCHNGKPRPQTISEAVGERYRADGPDAGVEYFLALRERNYGGAAYDFRARSVNELASEFYEAGDTVTAVRFFEMNAEHYPESWEAQESLGDVAAGRGGTELAIQYYERALELSPGNARVQGKLQRIR